MTSKTGLLFGVLAFAVGLLASCGGESSFIDPGSSQGCAASQQITGSLVTENLIGQPSPFTGTAVVVLERQTWEYPNPIPLYTPVTQISADPSGNFALCAAEPGTYLVAAAGTGTDGTVYGPTVVPDLSPGSKVPPMPLSFGVSFGSAPAVLPTTITGQVTTSPNPAEVEISVVDYVQNGSFDFGYVVPQLKQSSAVLKVKTTAGNGCSAAACGSYTAVVASRPAIAPISTTFTGGGTPTVLGWGMMGGTTTTFTVSGRPVGSSCTPSLPQLVVTDVNGAFLQAQPGATLTAKSMSFSGC